jgi:hypothetical protein
MDTFFYLCSLFSAFMLGLSIRGKESYKWYLVFTFGTSALCFIVAALL